MVAIQKADVYMFDEPSSYLDVKQRLQAARAIRTLVVGPEGIPDRYILVVEHDLAVLDYLSDFICCLYGTPSAYGVVTLPFSVREGINVFLAGFIPTENLRFRDEELNFRMTTNTAELYDSDRNSMYHYPSMTKTMRQGGKDGSPEQVFILHVEHVRVTNFHSLMSNYCVHVYNYIIIRVNSRTPKFLSCLEKTERERFAAPFICFTLK